MVEEANVRFVELAVVLDFDELANHLRERNVLLIDIGSAAALAQLGVVTALRVKPPLALLALRVVGIVVILGLSAVAPDKEILAAMLLANEQPDLLLFLV